MSAASHFNWTQLLPGVEHASETSAGNVHIVTLAISSAALIFLSFYLKAKLGKGDAALKPSSKLSPRAVVEVLTEMFVNLSDPLLGKKNRKYLPLFLSIFVFIWLNNLIGLIPGMTPATDNMNTNVAVGLFVFILYNFFGIREHGIVSYLKHFAGPMLLIAPLMIPVELISHGIRPLTLGFRLYGNMLVDHTILGVSLDLIPLILPMAFYVLGLFVCTIQAFVFTFLSMIYVSMAVSHDH